MAEKTTDQKMVKLVAPKGTDEVNAGETAYRVDNDGTVEVPEDAVEPLIEKGGCVVAPTTPVEDDAGNVRLAHPDGCGCSWSGRSYEPDDAGVITVPARAFADLTSHGFTPAQA